MNVISDEFPLLRTINSAAEEIKCIDGNTAVTKYAIRRLAEEEVIPSLFTGKKRLINLNDVLRYYKIEKTKI